MIGATALVMVEASYTHRQFDAELRDVPELAHQTGQEPGRVAQQQPRRIH